MNILIINYEFPPIGAGAANASWFIARSLKKLGHTVAVLTSNFRQLQGRSDREGITIWRIPTVRRSHYKSNIFEMTCFSLSSLFFVRQIAKKCRTEYVIAFFTIPSGITALFLNWADRIPYLISLRGGDVPGLVPELDIIHKILTLPRRRVLRSAAGLVANSQGLKALSENADPFPVNVIPNGVDTDFLIPAPDRRCEKKIFLFVGRFRPQKNLFFLLQQMNTVADTHAETFELHLVGGGPLEKELKAYADTLKSRNHIFWHDWCDKEQLKQYYQQAYCFLNPSFYEGMPNTVLEAMACGLPVIASRIIGNEEVVRHGETGFLFDLNSPESFQNIAVQLLENETLARNMGNKGRTLAEKEFSWDSVAKDYLRLIVRVMQK